jgi:glycosyltransferase involved in cell wall biosynthesis
MNFKTYTAKNGEEFLYTGCPSFEVLETLVDSAGDLWHSSLDQGFKNYFPELVYQATVLWWYINDFENLDRTICWRLNIEAFVIRKNVWEQLEGIDLNYTIPAMQGLDLGYNMLYNLGSIPYHIKGLFEPELVERKVASVDRYLFFRKYFRPFQTFYMMYRKGLFNFISEYAAYRKAKKIVKLTKEKLITPRKLQPIAGNPTVSLIIPTMRRQEYSQLLLEDHKTQSYPITQAVIVDATPEDERDPKYYRQEDFDFKVDVFWQQSKGSCRARNEAIAKCTGDYIIFADDDIRILPDFVENHIRLLQTYNVAACNGLDIMAAHQEQDLSDLKIALKRLGNQRWKVGATSSFSNANSCVRKTVVDEIIGNDINFDGGYGEDRDFGLEIVKKGYTVLHNPFSVNLHLKPPQGGYRWWGKQAKITGKHRKKQPWELNHPVKFIKPIPSPTVLYGYIKHFPEENVREYKKKYFYIYLFRGPKAKFFHRLLNIPYRHLQFKKSLFYAKKLMELGVRFK